MTRAEYIATLRPLTLNTLMRKAHQRGVSLDAMIDVAYAESERTAALNRLLGDNAACRAVLARKARSLGRHFVLSTLFVALLASCVEHGRGFYIREAVEAFAPVACARLQRCQPDSFPFESLAMCAAAAVDAACDATECDVPFPASQADFETCLLAFEQTPCVSTVPPRNCLEVG